MEREEKVKEGERKRGELMVEKLKRGILVGKREGKSTPSPTWKFGLAQPDGTLIQDPNFPTNLTTLSARKLACNLWEMEAQFNHRVANINKEGPILSNPNELDEAADHVSPSKQEISSINLKRQVHSPLQHNARIDKVRQAQQPLSPASCSSSTEMALRRSAVSPNSSFVSNGKFGESSYSLKTSTELLKVLNRIWSLEEKHALDMSLVKTLKRELRQSQAQIQELMQEKKRDENEIDHLRNQIKERKVERKKEHQRINGAVKLVEDKLEEELKTRRHSEKRHHRLGKELSQMKSSFSSVLRELDRERKARILLEDLCDEFAKGIRDYEQEVRLVKHKYCKDQIGREGNDRLILHISEAWLDERAQMKLADACDVTRHHSALDKLCSEIQGFLKEKQSDTSGKNADLSSHSLESFHLNEPASAPWHGNDEDESIAVTDHHPHLSRGYSLKRVNKKVHSRRGSDPSCSQSQIQLEEHVFERKHEHTNEGSTKSRTGNSNEASQSRVPRKGEILQRSSKTRMAHMKLRDDGYNVEGFFDPSTFVGPASPVKKWTAEVSAADPDISESSMGWPNTNSVKQNTLKAKLIEARLEGQQSRTRNSRGLSKVD